MGKPSLKPQADWLLEPSPLDSEAWLEIYFERSQMRPFFVGVICLNHQVRR